MFVATATIDKRRLNLLDPAVCGRREWLKEAGGKGELMCPHCGQEVRARLGDVRRPHFAHKSLEDCPFQKESAEVAEVKAILYTFFQKQVGCSVEMEVPLDGESARGGVLLDLLVETEAGTRFGYWIFDRNRRDRHLLLDTAKAVGIAPAVIQTVGQVAYHSPDTLLLSKSLRDLITISPFDQGFGLRSGGHLHFLDDAGILTTFRRLHCVHRPNVYGWGVRRTTPLQEARFDPESGDIVIEEDVENWLEHVRLEQERKEKRLGEEEARRKACEKKEGSLRKVYADVPGNRHRRTQVLEPRTPAVNPLNQMYPCQYCGVETRDWVKLVPSERVCICRECNAKRLEE